MTYNADPQYIDVKQVSAILGIGVSTAWLWCKNKPAFPKAIKFSTRCTRFSLDELNSFVANSRTAVA